MKMALWPLYFHMEYYLEEHAEGVIRKYLVEDKNYLDAVIGLPANIFYGTSIPTVILVFKKCREDDADVLFIDASKYFEKIEKSEFLKK